jgi:hypothetical protein
VNDPPEGAVTSIVLVTTSTGCEGGIVIVAPEDKARNCQLKSQESVVQDSSTHKGSKLEEA